MLDLRWASGLAVSAALTIGCTEKHVRPSVGAELVFAEAIDDARGLLLFVRGSSDVEGRRVLAAHTAAGPIRWQTAIDNRHAIDLERPLRLVGDSALVMVGPDMAPDGLLHVRLADGAVHEWRPPGPGTFQTAVGDGEQVIVFWDGPVASPYVRTMHIEAYDPGTGERTWSVTRERAMARPTPKLADKLLLYSELDNDWRAIRRSDGAAVELPIVDAPGLCHAAGRWWARRDDRLLAIDLRGEDPAHASTLVDFVPAGAVHQWSLIDCAEREDEVVLKLELETTRTGLLVGVDAKSMATRWTLPLPDRSPEVDERGFGVEWPRRLGPTTVLRLGDVNDAPYCAVDLVGHRLLWCYSSYDRHASYVVGEDTVLRIRNEPPEGDMRTTYYVHVRGADGEIDAAVRVGEPTRHPWDGGYVVPLRGESLWLPLPDTTRESLDQIPLLVLDARTLRPNYPQAFGRGDALGRFADAMDVVDEVFPRTPTLAPSRSPPGPTVVADPLGRLFQRTADGTLPDETHEDRVRVLAPVLADAVLPPGTKIHVLAWSASDVVGFVEHSLDGAPHWTLLMSPRVLDPRPGMPTRYTRTFARRPTEVDVQRFVLWGQYDMSWTPRPQVAPGRGEIDEAAWSALTQGPRVQRWTLE